MNLALQRASSEDRAEGAVLEVTEDHPYYETLAHFKDIGNSTLYFDLEDPSQRPSIQEIAKQNNLTLLKSFANWVGDIESPPPPAPKLPPGLSILLGIASLGLAYAINHMSGPTHYQSTIIGTDNHNTIIAIVLASLMMAAGWANRLHKDRMRLKASLLRQAA